MEGMSSAEELIEVWNKFKSEDEPELVVNWEFQDIESLGESNKVYIQNLRSLYNSKTIFNPKLEIKVTSERDVSPTQIPTTILKPHYNISLFVVS